MNSFVIVEVQILLLQRVLDSDQLSVVMNPGDLHEKTIKNPVHRRGAPMVRGLIGNQVPGKLGCRFESCPLRTYAPMV